MATTPIPPYDPVATEVAEPTSSRKVSTAAAEFRRVKELLTRAVIVPAGEPQLQIPALATRRGKLQGYDDSGNPIAVLADSIAGISYTLPAAGGVERSAASKLGDFINVLDGGAIADGAWNGTDATGHDNLLAFNIALAAAVTLNITRVQASGHFRLSGSFVTPRGVVLEGSGPAHLQAFTAGIKRGTALLIPGAAAGFCVSLEENGSHSGLRNLSVFNTTTNAVAGVVGVVGHLYPEVDNVEIASLRRSLGNGLCIKPSAVAPFYETLWGTFRNVKVIIDQVGTANEASVRWGLDLVGITNSRRPNANAFFGGQFSGTWGAMRSDGDAAGSGALSAAFFGTKFDAIWDAATPFAALYRAAASGVFGWTKANCYVWPVVQIKKGFNLAFTNCYFEAAGAPGTFNDGVNGSASLLCTVWIDSPAECVGTGIVDANWNGVYLYDNGSKTVVTPTTDGYSHSTRPAANLVARPSATQSIPTATWTKVQTPSVLVGDNSHIEWDAAASLVRIRSAGTYLFSGQVEYAGWAVLAGTYAISRININAGAYVFGGQTAAPNGAGNAISSQANPPCMQLAAGDTVALETLHNQGANQSTSGSNTFFGVTKLV